MEKKYTAAQVALMFGKEPKEITARIKKGGIKGVEVSETEDGFVYLLTEKTVDQFGALYGLVPKYEAVEEQKIKRVYIIDGKAFKDALTKAGYRASVVSKAIGKADNYISNCCDRNRINAEAANEVQRIFGVDATKYVVKDESAEPKVEKTVDHKDIGETMRGAVYNGMIDAILMTLKEDTVRKMVLRILEDETVQNTIQKVLFRAIDGSLNKGRSMHAGLIPQNGVKR